MTPPGGGTAAIGVGTSGAFAGGWPPVGWSAGRPAGCPPGAFAGAGPVAVAPAPGPKMPSSAVLTEILDVVARADIDAQPVLRWAGGEVRRFRRELHFIHTPIPLSAGAGELDWHPAAEQALSLPYGMLSAIPVRGAGIPQRLVPPAGLIVRFRRGGERCQPLGRRHSQTLKHALQDSAVPPWERRLIPLIYNGETLLAAGDAFVTDDSRCAADEDGWLPRWSR